MKQVMVDLETMGRLPGCAIIAIGAVKFDMSGIDSGQPFYRNVNLKSCMDWGLTIDPDTLMWWLQQSADAREALFRNQLPLKECLEDFADWMGGDLPVWGCGAAFDNPILSVAFDKTNVKRPWTYRNDRCYRTMREICPDIEVERVGTYHNALDDAKTQALHLIRILKELPEGHMLG